MKRILKCCFSFVLMMVFVGCSDKKQEKNDMLLKDVNVSLLTATGITVGNNYKIMKAFEKQMNSPLTFEYTKPWMSKATAIHHFSKQVYDSIEKMKQVLEVSSTNAYEVMLKNDKGKELYKMLKQCRDTLLNFDSAIKVEFASDTIITTKTFDSFPGKLKDFAKYFFEGKSTLQALLTLNKFQSDVVSFENQLLSFCLSKIAPTTFCDYWETRIKMFTYHTSKSVLPNQMIDVCVRLEDDYFRVVKPVVKIGNIQTTIDNELFSVRTVKASEKIGKHSIPITVSYKDFATGQDYTVTRMLDYYVDSIPTKP